MNIFLIGILLFLGGLTGLALTLFLAYYFPANMVRSAMTAGAISAGSLATRIPKKKKVFSYLFKQIFYRKSWANRLSTGRIKIARAKASIKEVGVVRSAGMGARVLVVAGWGALKSFTKALLLPYAIAAGVSASAMVIGGFCMLIAAALWVFSALV